MIKPSGSVGVPNEHCLEWLRERLVDDVFCDEFIEQLISAGSVYRSADNKRIIAALTREEAAQKIGVSKTRLKKWGRMDWAGGVSGPPYIKASSKGRTYYKHDDVDNFIAHREPHSLDLSRCGQRELCVEGGKLGGRPKSKIVQNATL
jgi:hypothetical protein